MDYALYAIGSTPKNFDVVLADNLFGDLVSDQIGMITGSLGMLPSATILSVAMMFEYAFARSDMAREIENAVEETLRQGFLTPDLGGASKTVDVTAAVLSALNS
jgi:3-isopropylmalate dehydrogenase